jgi:hypothetical protein
MPRKTRRAPVSSDKRLKKNKSADGAPPQRWQHGDFTIEETQEAGMFVMRATTSHCLDILLQHQLIDDVCHEAGLLLHKDYQLAKIEGRVGASYQPQTNQTQKGFRTHDRHEKEEAAYQRWRCAIEQIDHDWRGRVIHVCCMGLSPDITYLLPLKKGLLQLVQHYRLKK